MNNIKVYKMDDCEWWATKWSLEDTNNYFEKEYLVENDINQIEECNLDTDGMWYETDDIEDIERLGESDEIHGIEVVDGRTVRKTSFGDLQRKEGCVFKFMSFRDVLDEYGEFDEPFMIASTEW